MNTKFTLRFWGTRGSYPVPGKSTLYFGGNTACIEVQVKNNLLIFESGTGIIKLGEKLAGITKKSKPLTASIFITHTHHDHMQGLAFFTPAYQPHNTIYIFGPKMFDEDIEEALSKSFLPTYFPVRLNEMRSIKMIKNLDNSCTVFYRPGNHIPDIKMPHECKTIPKKYVKVSSLKSRAHTTDCVLIYKVETDNKKMVLATDIEGYKGGDQNLIKFAKGADILIHDAQYEISEYLNSDDPREGYGHSTYKMAAEVAIKAGVKKLILFHHDPGHNDEDIRQIEEEAKKIFPETIAAYEGMEISL